MIRKLKEKLKKIEGQLEDSIKGNEFVEQSLQIHNDYQQIASLFSHGEYIPFTSWSISPSTILHIFNDILLNEKKRILEFGAGSSTFFIAKFLKVNAFTDVKFYSIESDKNWIEKITNLGNKYGLQDYINIIYSPVTDVLISDFRWKNQTKWYDIEKLEDSLQELVFDLVLVDGPWNGFSPYVRFSAIPFLKNNLSERASIFLDDTFRKEELEIVHEWKKILNFQLKHFNKYSVLWNEELYNVEPFRLNKWTK